MSAMSTVPANPVKRLVPFAHVAGVDQSLAFYSFLGFTPQSVLRDPKGKAFWALAQSGGGSANSAEIMFAQSSGPIAADQQAVLFYMYCDNVAELRSHLLACGIRDGGRYSGAASLTDTFGSVFEVAHPPHMPAGELRLLDPDGYVILVGQLG